MTTLNTAYSQQPATSPRDSAKRFGKAGLLVGVALGLVLGEGMTGIAQLGLLTGGMLGFGGAIAGGIFHHLTAKSRKARVVAENLHASQVMLAHQCMPEYKAQKTAQVYPMGLSSVDPEAATAQQAQARYCSAPENQDMSPQASASGSSHLPPEWISPNAAGKRPTHELSAMRH